jgi:hypothetical protein
MMVGRETVNVIGGKTVRTQAARVKPPVWNSDVPLNSPPGKTDGFCQMIVSSTLIGTSRATAHQTVITDVIAYRASSARTR